MWSGQVAGEEGRREGGRWDGLELGSATTKLGALSFFWGGRGRERENPNGPLLGG